MSVDSVGLFGFRRLRSGFQSFRMPLNEFCSFGISTIAQNEMTSVAMVFSVGNATPGKHSA